MVKSKKYGSPLEEAIELLKKAAAAVENADPATDARLLKREQLALEQLGQALLSRASKIDPVIRPESIFDPADPKTAGRVIALTMVAQDKHSLADLPAFYGAGVYANYYRGPFKPYQPLQRTDHPIYVGKADPNSTEAKTATSQGAKLYQRLNEHSKSISKAKDTLKLTDFDCRFLVVQTGFQASAEAYLIDFFKPIWNSETKVCGGLGKHGDSATTRANKRSPWDTLHPGRLWADATKGNQVEPADIRTQIAAHFRKHPPYQDMHAVFDHFMGEMRQIRRPVPVSMASGAA